MHYVSIFAYVLWNRFYNLGLWLNSGRSTFEAAASEESKPRMLVGSMAKKNWIIISMDVIQRNTY